MRILTLASSLCLIIPFLSAQRSTTTRENVTFVNDRQWLPDAAWQAELRQRPVWQAFLAAHGTWFVEFNENNAKPHRAYGKPVATTGANPLERAQGFISAELQDFGIPSGELHLLSVAPTTKQTYVHFKQMHSGLDVLFSHLMVKLDNAGRAIAFGADVYDAITVDPMPTMSAADAIISAGAGLTGVTATAVESAPAILPVPVFKGTDFHLVYQVTVNTMNDHLPGRFTCYVDAHDGKLLYRHNEVVEHHPHGPVAAAPPPATDLTLTATVYEFHPFIPALSLPLAHVEVVISGTTYNTDMVGFATSPDPGPISATFSLQGDWSTVRTGGITPSFTTTLINGTNLVDFDNDANIRERSAYFHVNIIHDHHKTYLPAFTGMDWSLPTNVDVTGTCNAFYDGSSINFYAEGGGCQSYANLGEVVYHEYGHGINDNFYQSLGSNFNNGAIGEGYADVWGLSVTEDPILAEGSDLVDSTLYIRRYDQDPKVYPTDILGEVHADGEIIAGAWWDTYVLLGNDMVHTMTLFADAYPGLQATAADGNEGVAFRDVLLDVLAADDDDADITNGTPNGNAIVEAFAIHGITLISNATLIHDPIEISAASTGILVDADLTLVFPFTTYLSNVLLRYRINNGSTWTDVNMTNVGGSIYEATIPAQPEGTVVAYYLGVQDIFMQLSAVLPSGAQLVEPNIPYYILVGFALDDTQDCDNNTNLGNWQLGAADDNNSTGDWELGIPVGSFTTGGIIVQTDAQHTPGGEQCFFTGNAGTTDGIGVNDVDGGKTTLWCDPMDLSALDNPTFTFWRWYTNNPPGGANPGQDWWRMDISNNGSTWVPVENTRTSDKSWRRFAFRVQDYVTPNSSVRIRFVASDSIHLGQNLDGGSLIEAAVDDIQLWENAGGIGIEEETAVALLNVLPNPASAEVMIDIAATGMDRLHLQVIDDTGRMVMEREEKNGATRQVLDVRSLPPGGYVLRARWSGGSADRRFTIVR